MAQLTLLLAALFAALSVALGAFAAHGLQAHLNSAAIDVFKTAAQYQFMHALALLAVGVWLLHAPQSLPWLQVAVWAWVLGIVLFSGSLYGLTLTDWRWLGPITPLGGLSFIIGWIALGVAAWQSGAKLGS